MNLIVADSRAKANSTEADARPQTGLVHVARQGDWTNAGRVSADVTIRRTRNRMGWPSAVAFLREDDLKVRRARRLVGRSGLAAFLWPEAFRAPGWRRPPVQDTLMGLARLEPSDS